MHILAAVMAEEGFQAFIERRRDEAARRQHRVVGALIGCLTLACVALAISTVILAERLAAVRAGVTAVRPAITTSDAPDEESPSALPRAELPQPAPAPPSAAALVEEPVAPGPPLIIRKPTTSEPPPPQPARSRPIRVEADPARLIADWMVERYGRAAAEERAATAAGFYPADDPSGAHWRAVLAHIQRGGPDMAPTPPHARSAPAKP